MQRTLAPALPKRSKPMRSRSFSISERLRLRTSSSPFTTAMMKRTLLSQRLWSCWAACKDKEGRHQVCTR